MNARAILVGSLTCLAILSARPAQADHQSYRYTGTCYGFQGEAHLIDALVHMDDACLTQYNYRRIRQTSYAKQDVARAYYDVCDPCARGELRSALRHLSRYIWTADVCDLDRASQHILAALTHEQIAHGFGTAPSAPFVKSDFDYFPPRIIAHNFHHELYDHGHYHQSGQLSFGNRNFRFSFGF